MTTRLLPVDEWGRLEGFAIWPQLQVVIDTNKAQTCGVMVVEDDGVIVGCFGLFPRVIAEGIEISEAHQKKGVVLRHLLSAMCAEAASMGATQVLSTCDADDVRAILDGLGATRLPDLYSWTFRVE